MDRRERFISLCLLTALAALTALHIAGMVAPAGGLKDLAVNWIYYVVILGSGLVVLARAALVKRDRLAWTLIGVGAVSSGVAEIVYTLAYADLKHPPYPSIADALWLAYYPFIAAGVLVLARRVVGRVGLALGLDGTIAAVGAAALAA